MKSGSLVRLAVLTSLMAGCSFIWPEKYKLREAEELEKGARYPEAAAMYEMVFTKWPKSREADEAYSRAAAVYEERLNNWQKAAAYLQELRTRTEGRPTHASVLLRLGRVLEHAGTPYTDSLQTYGILCRNCASAPEAVSALVAQGRLQESMQRWAQAKGVYEDALARYGKSAEAPTIRVRLEAVWQFEAMGLYYAGEVEHGVTLAQEAMKKGITVDEVRNGLEALLTRHKKARQLWKTEAAAVVREESTRTDQPDPGHFVYRYERDAEPKAPEGWSAVYDVKRKRLTLKELPPAPPPSEVPVVAAAADSKAGKAGGAAKSKSKPKPVPKLWTWRSSPEVEVVGYWFSPDGRRLAWIGKHDTGKRTLNVIDLVKHKGSVVMSDSEGSLLGGVVAFLPYADKVVFPYGAYVMVSDLRGGNRTSFPPDGDAGEGKALKGRRAQSLSTTSDGLEVLLETVPIPPKKRKNSPETPAPTYWKIGLGVASF